jgi:hypothetical protein
MMGNTEIANVSTTTASFSFSYTTSNTYPLTLTVDLLNPTANINSKQDILVDLLSLSLDSDAYQGYEGYEMQITGSINDTSMAYSLELTDGNTLYANTVTNTDDGSFSFTYTPNTTANVIIYVDAMDSQGMALCMSDPIMFTPAILTYPTAPTNLYAGDSISISDLVGGNIADLSGNLLFETPTGDLLETWSNLTPSTTSLPVVFFDDYNNVIEANISIMVTEID